MLETPGFVLLTICIKYITTEYIIHSDGWIPVTRDQVYNQIHRKWTHNFIPTTQKPAIENINTFNQIKSKYNNQNTIKMEDDSNIFDSAQQNIPTQLESNNENIIHIENTISAINLQRKAKKMINKPLLNNNDIVDNPGISKNVELIERDENKMYSIIDRSNTYEVTEHDYNSQETESQSDDAEEGIGYSYMPPSTQNLNLTSTLINILSKYNIKVDDKLQNYDLSRRNKIQNPAINAQGIIPHRYNSPNHLPVDPLFAVFLSNYGVYLPSLYGIKSNYNNLYGYLASNNIHNNRPFGLYKIFSDTDSWN